MGELTKFDRAVTVAIPDAAKAKLNAFWAAHKNQIAAVTAGGDEKRIMAVTYSLLWRTPKLIECSPFSLLNGIVLAHQLGLTFGTQEVALVPFGGEATLIIQYQGKLKLALASKLVTAVHADVVLRGELFEYEMRETGPHFRHVPQIDGRQEPTEQNVAAAYCQIKTSEGGIQTRIVTLQEILSARARSRGYKYQIQKGGSDNPWITDFQAMALKTAVHRAMKFAPQDSRLGLATSIDDADEGGNPVIAEGLNPGDFADAELQKPLIEMGKEAQADIAEAKIDLLKQGVPASELEGQLQASVENVRSRKRQNGAATHPTYPTWDAVKASYEGGEYDPALGKDIVVGGKHFHRERFEESWVVQK